LPPHLFFQAILAGTAVLLPVASYQLWTSRNAPLTDFDLGFWEDYCLAWILAISSLVHLLMVWGEVSLTHPTSHSRLAVWEMVKGRYKAEFWMGITLSFLGGLLPLLALLHVWDMAYGIGGAPLALFGLALFEHAYVQAGQAVPLA